MFTGLDWGGVRREWFESVCTELFDPSASQLFRRMTDDSQGLVSTTLLLVEQNSYRLVDKVRNCR